MTKMVSFLAIENGSCLLKSAVFTVSTPSKPLVKKTEALEELCVAV
jgi:hypothetical protein